MRERKKKLGTHSMSVRLFTLTDKKSSFRAQEDDVHIVQLMINTGRSNVIVREIQFKSDEQSQATDMYDQLVEMFK